MDLRTVEQDSDLWLFTRTWLERFNRTPEDNFVEKFIYLWVTFNAWASLAVPDATRSYEDSYLIHSVAASSRFQKRFHDFLKSKLYFKEQVEKLIGLGPVFEVR